MGYDAASTARGACAVHEEPAGAFMRGIRLLSMGVLVIIASALSGCGGDDEKKKKKSGGSGGSAGADAGSDATAGGGGVAGASGSGGTGGGAGAPPIDAGSDVEEDAGMVEEPHATMSAGTSHTCFVAQDGRLKCWGQGAYGQLGLGSTLDIGDTETPASVAAVPVTGNVIQVAAGNAHTCALVETGEVICWGFGAGGQLGVPGAVIVGDDEDASMATAVDLGGTAVQVSATGDHTCALLDTNNIVCWGNGADGRLGYGNTDTIGDTEAPSAAGTVDVGGPVREVAAGGKHTCALLDSGDVRCWGEGLQGKLGNASTETVGDKEVPSSVAAIDLGGKARQISAGGFHTCAVLEDDSVVCWGRGDSGQLGYASIDDIGDGETPASQGAVDVGGPVRRVAVGNSHTCALLLSGEVKCWGLPTFGQLGYGDQEPVGDDEAPSAVGAVDVGGTAVDIAAGDAHSCAVLDGDLAVCWGLGINGRLGYSATDNIGDNEVPSSVGTIMLF